MIAEFFAPGHPGFGAFDINERDHWSYNRAMKTSKPISSVNSPLGPWSAEDFIQSCWQQVPLLIPAAMPAISALINKQDLIDIACDPDAEARLIIANQKQTDWQCQQGPFKIKEFKALSSKDRSKQPWTLLVQAVDQWIPEVADLLKHFAFLPRWRLDDVMISYATEGGGVGPHFDHYDVFLIQASGTRRWQIGQRCDDKSPLRIHPTMKLLKHFNPGAAYDVSAGDMLYIPAGIAHWGTATSDDCITVSIGFRAASHGELIQMALNKIASALPESQRYRDSDAAMDADPFCINHHTGEPLYEMFKKLDAGQIKKALIQALGEYATESRYPDHIYVEETAEKILTLKRFNNLLNKHKALVIKHHPASRFAYHPLSKKDAELYVDGETHVTSLKLARAICYSGGHSAAISADLLANEESKLFLLTLINQGSLRVAL